MRNPICRESTHAQGGHNRELPPNFTGSKPSPRDLRKKPPKVTVSLRIDQEIVNAYEITGGNWRKMMVDVLRQYALKKARNGGLAIIGATEEP